MIYFYSSFVNHTHGLDFIVVSPSSVFSHSFNVIINILSDVNLIKLFVVLNVVHCLLPDFLVMAFIPIELMRNGSKKTVSIRLDVNEVEVEFLELFSEFFDFLVERIILHDYTLPLAKLNFNFSVNLIY